MTKKQDCIVVEPSIAADATVIWLHGLGADAEDFVGVIDQLGLPAKHAVRFIFPNAPFIHVTVNQGMSMRGWYDIYDLNLLRKEDELGVEKSRQFVTELIAQEIAAGIASNRIILAGFSQGGAISLYTGLRYLQPLAGIIVLSAYLPLANKFVASDFMANRSTPIFMAHGLFDPVVPFHAGKNTYQQLQEQNFAVDWKTYPMPHTVTADEIIEIGEFINRCIANA